MINDIDISELNEERLCVDLLTMKDKDGINKYELEPYPADWSGNLLEFIERLPGDYAIWVTRIPNYTTHGEKVRIIDSLLPLTDDHQVQRFGSLYKLHAASSAYDGFVNSVLGSIEQEDIKNSLVSALTD